MRELRDRTGIRVGDRLTLLRKERGYTQIDFANEFSKFCDTAKPFIVSTVSSWEQNHRLPNMELIKKLALFYGVSVDFLFGLTDQRSNDSILRKQSEIKDIIRYSDISIPWNEYPKYHGLPVYIRFKYHTHIDQWGILNYTKNIVVCKDTSFDITEAIEIFSYTVSPPLKTQIVTRDQLLSANSVIITMKYPDPEAGALYNGRYHHNENRSCLINSGGSGLTLPYSGLNVSYWAFRG